MYVGLYVYNDKYNHWQLPHLDIMVLASPRRPRPPVDPDDGTL